MPESPLTVTHKVAVGYEPAVNAGRSGSALQALAPPSGLAEVKPVEPSLTKHFGPGAQNAPYSVLEPSKSALDQAPAPSVGSLVTVTSPALPVAIHSEVDGHVNPLIAGMPARLADVQSLAVTVGSLVVHTREIPPITHSDADGPVDPLRQVNPGGQRVYTPRRSVPSTASQRRSSPGRPVPSQGSSSTRPRAWASAPPCPGRTPAPCCSARRMLVDELLDERRIRAATTARST